MPPRRSAPADDETRKGVLYIRAEPELIAALDKEAQAISKAAGGLYVSRSNAARVVLRRALSHHLAEGNGDTAPEPATSSKPAKSTKPARPERKRKH